MMDDVLNRNKCILVKRAVLSYCVLTVFLFLPTMWLRKRFVLAIARLPLWKEFDFFKAMYAIIQNVNNDTLSRGETEASGRSRNA